MRWGAIVSLLAALVTTCALASSAGARGRDGLTPDVDLAIVQRGLDAIDTSWWDATAGWYYDMYDHNPPSMPLARLWSAFPVFETLNGVAIAQPTDANKAAVRKFADAAAKLYWNPLVRPFGGYDWYPNYATSTGVLYFDDSGWWGLGFVDAYAATGKKAYLADARRALNFIVNTGWDHFGGGGTWWDTAHSHKTIEPLAAAVVIATRLYEAKHLQKDRRTALWLLDWANAHSFHKGRGLYQRSASDDTVMDYVQGLMITANWELCKTLKRPALCKKAKALANAALVAFPRDLNWSPQFDVVYLRWMLQYGKESGDRRWYRLAVHNAERALANARNGNGWFVKNWDGSVLGYALAHHAANLELFAWLAATAP